MQRLFTTFLIATLLVHAAFGCCLHHAHACGSECEPTQVVHKASESCCHHGHGDNHGPSKPCDSTSLEKEVGGSSPCRHEESACEEDHCNFARTETVHGVDLLDAKYLLAVLSIADIGGLQIPNASLHAFSFMHDAASFALRRHLVLAVFLI